MNDDKPTEITPSVLTHEDIDNAIKKYAEEALKPTPMSNCPSCNEEFPTILTDYYTGQCEKCFYLKKPFFHKSPVRGAYFIVTDE